MYIMTLSSWNPMFTISAKQALLPSGWSTNVQVSVDHVGRIIDVRNDVTAKSDHDAGILLPAPVNVHSHAFQRAMAGLTERRGPNPTDSFWTWRDLMFRFLDQLTPEHVEAITGFVQMEMLEEKYSGSLAKCMQYATVALDPEGIVVKNRLDGYTGMPMYFALYKFCELTEPLPE